jgi:ribosome recycling factor
MTTTPDAILQDTRKRMHSSIETLKKEMATIRTGRAHASLLDTVHVEYYGSNLPLAQLATVTVTRAASRPSRPASSRASWASIPPTTAT